MNPNSQQCRNGLSGLWQIMMRRQWLASPRLVFIGVKVMRGTGKKLYKGHDAKLFQHSVVEEACRLCFFYKVTQLSRCVQLQVIVVSFAMYLPCCRLPRISGDVSCALSCSECCEEYGLRR